MASVDELLALWPAVDKAVRVVKQGHPYTEKDPNFYSNWLIHLHEELRILRKIAARKGDEAAAKYAAGWHRGSGANPRRLAHTFGSEYVHWVATLSGDRRFPANFKKASMSKLAEDINVLFEASPGTIEEGQQVMKWAQSAQAAVRQMNGDLRQIAGFLHYRLYDRSGRRKGVLRDEGEYLTGDSRKKAARVHGELMAIVEGRGKEEALWRRVKRLMSEFEELQDELGYQ